MRAFVLTLLAVACLATAPAAIAAQQDRVDRLTDAQLRAEAAKVGRHGGILCATHGVGARCATPYMRRLTAELVSRAVAPQDVPWALCVTGRESGFNPGAISTTGDHGVGQINYVSHTWIDRDRITYASSVSPTGWASDVLYSVAVFTRVSGHGSFRSPWAGGSHSC